MTLALTAGSAQPVAAITDGGSIGLRLVDAPEAAATDPRARLYIIDHLAPGTVIHRRIEVSNTGSSPAHVVLYPAGATIAKGSFVGATGHTRNELSTWTSVSPRAADVPAGGQVTAKVTISVPKNAAPEEQYGVVWAEARSTPKSPGGLIEVSRVGIRVYLSVGPGGPPAADFAIEALTAQRSPDGRPTILATVRNTGGRALDMSGTLELLSGPGGLSAGPFPAILGTTLAIGATEPVTIVLDKRLPAGPWDAQITLRSGLLERKAQATITFPKAGAAPPAQTSTRPGWIYLVLIGLLVLLVLVALKVIRGRRGRRRQIVAEATAV